MTEVHRGSFGHLCLRAKTLVTVQLLPYNSWVHHIILHNYSVYPDAETWVVEISHVCQPTELSWSNKDTYMVTVFWWQCSRKPKVWFFLGKYMWVGWFGCFLSLKMVKANSRALRSSQDLVTVKQNECFHQNVVSCTQESTN